MIIYDHLPVYGYKLTYYVNEENNNEKLRCYSRGGAAVEASSDSTSVVTKVWVVVNQCKGPIYTSGSLSFSDQEPLGGSLKSLPTTMIQEKLNFIRNHFIYTISRDQI